MAVRNYVLVIVCLFGSQILYSHGAGQPLPEYIQQITDRIINPTFMKLFKMRQINELVMERIKDVKSKGNPKEVTKPPTKGGNNNNNNNNNNNKAEGIEHCTVLNDEINLDEGFLKETEKLVSELLGYLGWFIVEASKCNQIKFSMNKLACNMKIGRDVARVYELYQQSATHAIDRLTSIDQYITRSAEKCFVYEQ
ncbi:uncharacterized protein [Rhodnius prolixus]|uniref:uncharacterized protein n=1 Tax=Rhodnius prolixus TaxID=13249 RepID=UPI003D18C971